MLAALGNEQNLEHVLNWVKIKEIIEPDDNLFEIYDELYEIYKKNCIFH